MYSERARHTGNFNPRFLAGATSAGSGGGDIAEFQSTLPYGSDEHLREPLGRRYYFNPRSLTGATGCNLPWTVPFWYFNPRSLTGATYHHERLFRTIFISIHAPLRERHQIPDTEKYLYKNFNPRSLTGATTLYKRDLQLFIFQSTLPYGSDPAHQQGFVPRYYFNPRSLTGATRERLFHTNAESISIHAPLRERLLPDIF